MISCCSAWRCSGERQHAIGGFGGFGGFGGLNMMSGIYL